MRHIFKAIKPQRIPMVGDLIRNNATGDYINIILEITPVNGVVKNKWGKEQEGKFLCIRSVRYGKTNRGDFKLLNGQRSKLFIYPSINLNYWEIVDEYMEVDNQKLRSKILETMQGVDTNYKFPTEHHHDEQ